MWEVALPSTSLPSLLSLASPHFARPQKAPEGIRNKLQVFIKAGGSFQSLPITF